MSTPVMAAGTEQIDVYDRQNRQVKSVVFIIGSDAYFVNGQTPGLKMDARPFIQEDRTFVPVRYLAYALGVTPENIGWDGVREKVGLKLEGNSVEMTVGVKQIIANGQSRTIDVAPVLRESEGRTYLPARHIAEGLGFEVDWDGKNSAVICWPKGSVRPDVSDVIDYIKMPNQPPAGYTESNGYYLPINTDMRIDPCEEIVYGVEMDVLVHLWKPLEKQYNELANILMSKFDKEVVNTVMEYVKQKKARNEDLPEKAWTVNKLNIEVRSPAGSDGIGIMVRRI
jgi:hypothetical protein